MAGLGPREAALEALADRAFEVLVVGGGITGAGVALELAARGRSCALVEARDFASGTSSRSSKLIHGGLRYLARGELGIVRESLRERGRLLAVAPGLVRPMPHLLPLGGGIGDIRARIVLGLYERLANEHGLPPYRVLTQAETESLFGGYGRIARRGAILYHEAHADDIRLTLAVLRAAVSAGAVVANHVRFDSYTRDTVELFDQLGEARVLTRSRAVAVATGVGLGTLAASLGWARMQMRPAKGIHVVLDRPAFGIRANALARHPDGRYLNVMPWHGRVLAGTTDTEIDDEAARRPVATATDVTYVLDAIGASAPEWRPVVRAAWAGLRPLLAQGSRATAALSREDRVVPLAQNVIGIAGGKLTTFAAVARRAADAVEDLLGGRRDGGELVTLSESLSGGTSPLVSGMPYTTGDLRAAARDEMAMTLEDAATFRLGLSFVAPDVADAHALEWGREVAGVHGWDDARVDREVASFRSSLKDYRFAG